MNKAGLLSETDIKAILLEQRARSLRFGDLAIAQGLLKPNTLNFFLQNLFPSQLNNAVKTSVKNKVNPQDKITSEDITYWATMSSAKLTRP